MKITAFLNGLLLIRFSLSKLFAWPISVQAFIDMARPIGIDPTFFRIFTGIIISTICLGYFISFYILIKNKTQENVRKLIYVAFFNFLGAMVMIGALGAEFLLRTEPKWPLVIIAFFIIITSVYNLICLKKFDVYSHLCHSSKLKLPENS